LKSLETLLRGVNLLQVWGDLTHEIVQITPDSRRVSRGTLFSAMRGVTDDGDRYIPQAIAAGATAIVTEKVAPEDLPESLCWIQVPDARQAHAELSAAFWDHPSRELRLVGITGTNGKTSVATLLWQLYSRMGFSAGLISTVDIRWPGHSEVARLTTPDVSDTQCLLRRMADAGCTHVFMEVSSHAAHQGRVAELHFSGGVFTNITHDHLDYHGTFANYIAAKKSFFDSLPSSAFALINTVDKHADVMVQNTRAHVVRYAMRGEADFRGRLLENSLAGLVLRIQSHTLSSRLLGDFNGANLLAAYGVGVLLGEKETDILQALSACTPAEGRMEWVRDETGRIGIVDYAHTPDALEKAIRTLLPLRPAGHRLLVVIGCGGDRDTLKRPVMGRLAGRLADMVVLTSDNPRSEDPEAILEAMESGVEAGDRTKVQRVTDRAQAIQVASRLARPGDILLVAGKGHEKYQEIRGQRLPFDDKKVLCEALKIYAPMSGA
jgi:UDP-N-acetylmuramoyl-L-alanyl-D-glutamate--2,6-diaminopimelate ligase